MTSFKPFALTPLILIAGCVAPVAPPPAPPPVAVTPPSPPLPAPAADWRDVPLTPGEWAYRTDAAGTQAMFGRPGMAADFILRCDAATRTVMLSRRGGQAGAMTISTSSATMNRPVQAGAGQPAYAVVSLRAMDPFLDRVAFSQGRITVQMENINRLVLPARAEPARVIEDCRR